MIQIKCLYSVIVHLKLLMDKEKSMFAAIKLMWTITSMALFPNNWNEKLLCLRRACPVESEQSLDQSESMGSLIGPA